MLVGNAIYDLIVFVSVRKDPYPALPARRSVDDFASNVACFDPVIVIDQLLKPLVAYSPLFLFDLRVEIWASSCRCLGAVVSEKVLQASLSVFDGATSATARWGRGRAA